MLSSEELAYGDQSVGAESIAYAGTMSCWFPSAAGIGSMVAQDSER